MACALIQKNPPSIIQVYPSDPVPYVNVPGKWQLQNVKVGWVADDNNYALVAALPFIPPGGHMSVGSPSYSIDGAGKISEIYATVPIPPPAPPSTVILFSTLVSRFSDSEYAALNKTLAALAAAGNGTAARWLELARTRGIDMTDPQTTTIKAQLVSAGILTQVRADAIFVAP